MKYRKLLALAIIGSFSLSHLSNIVYAEDISENYVEEVCTQENVDTAEPATDNNVNPNLEEDEQSETIDATNDEISEDISNNDEEIISEDTNDTENMTNELTELDETDEVETINDDEEHEHHYVYEKYNKHYHKKVCEDGDYEKLEKCVDENHDNVCELCGNDIEDVSTINSSINIEVKHFSDQTATIEYEDKTYEIEGTKGTLVLHVHNKSIAVISSNCPHQDCVRMGYVKDSSHPIVCAYNEVVIVIEGSSKADVGI